MIRWGWAALLAATPALAVACPVCNRDVSGATLFYLAGMIAFPYAVAVVVLKVVRSGDRDS